MKLPPATYTFHRNFDNCPRKAYHINIAKDLPKEPETVQLKWGSSVHKALENRINKGTPLPESMQQFEPFVSFGNFSASAEVKLGIRENGQPCNFFDSDVWARGVIDVVINCKPAINTVMFLDWKTGKPREEPGELEYHAALFQANTRTKLDRILGHYVWLQEPRIGQLHDLSDTRKTLETMRATQDDIGHRMAMGEQAFPPRQNPLCGWCSVTSCEFNRRK